MHQPCTPRDPEGLNGAVGAGPPTYTCALRISGSELLAFGGGLMCFLLPFHIASGDVLLTDSYS